MDVGLAPSVQLKERHLRVRFGSDGAGPRWADYHYRWLRHFCPCCRHPLTGERTVCSSEIAADVKPLRAELDGGDLVLEWKEGGGSHPSRFPLEWLRDNAYAPDREEMSPPATRVEDVALAMADLGDGFAATSLERLARDGVVVLRGAGEDTERLIGGFESRGLAVIPTHFGRIEDLRTDNTTNENTDQLGYTDAAVELHTDQPYIETPPRYQMLHCMRRAERGGDSSVADGIHAARHLQSLDATAYELLTTVPVRFDRRQKAFRSLQIRPIVELRDGEPHQVRLSYFTYGPHRIAFDLLEAWYAAYARYVAILEEHAIRFSLNAGDALVYDNHRMLHARTPFEGARWVRGVYFDTPGA